jgi:2-polyprenyl-3-methyl-5-hydroxy-6-metoxy-1,4-benzoquinol methylase
MLQGMGMDSISCIVCGNNDKFSTYLAGSETHPNYVKCTSCGLVFANPLVPVSYTDQREYSRHKEEAALNARLRNYELRYDAIRKHLSPSQNKFIDVGTHTGVFLKLLKTRGINALGAELNRKAVQFGREHYDVNIVTDSLEQLVRKGPFDVVTLFNVFEHMEQPLKALPQLRQLIDDNGLLVLEVPHIFTPQVAVFRGHWHHFYPEHFWFYNKKTITMLLQRHGFQILETSFVPKVTTVAWVLLLLGFVLRRIWNKRAGVRVPDSALYHFLDRRTVKVNINDYLLVIARRSNEPSRRSGNGRGH